jgi:hypothetical protein
MKEYLINLSRILNEIDNDPLKSLQFFTTSLSSTNITNKPLDSCRMILITDILYNLIRNLSQLNDISDIQKNMDGILHNINNKYQNNQHLCWKSHEHHFHQSFEDYVNCPTTCLYEVSEFFNKLNKECYVQ